MTTTTITTAPTLIETPHPGTYLLEDILKPAGISQYKLAKATGLTRSHVAEIVKGARGITPDAAVRLERATGVSAHMWLNWQAHYDLIEAERKLAGRAIPRLVAKPDPALVQAPRRSNRRKQLADISA